MVDSTGLPTLFKDVILITFFWSGVLRKAITNFIPQSRNNPEVTNPLLNCVDSTTGENQQSGKSTLMKKAGISLALSILLLFLATAICLPGMCGCVSWIGLPESEFGGMLAMALYAIAIPGILASICWLAFVAIRSAVKRIRNA